MKKFVWLGVILVAVTGCAPSLRELAVKIPSHEASYTPTTGNTMAPALDALLGQLQSWGVEVRYEQDMTGFGLTDMANRIIVLRADMPVNAAFEVLAHEAGHLFQPPSIELLAHAEAFAEAVAVGVAEHYNHPYRHTAARYMAGIKTGLHILPDVKVDVEFAVKALTGQTEYAGWWK